MSADERRCAPAVVLSTWQRPLPVGRSSHHFLPASSVHLDGTTTDPAGSAFRERQLALFRASVLKQAKWRALDEATAGLDVADGLDLGSDNGVISWLFRQRGGRWSSADLTQETVGAIRGMVGERVARIEGGALPWPDASFDLVVVVDMLEHVQDDRALLREIARCLRPGGHVVLNVPHSKRRALLPRIRHALGLTDAWHGHRRSGYTIDDLARLLPEELRLVEHRTYSRTFSHTLDTALNWVYRRKQGSRGTPTAKGTVVTGHDVGAGDARALRLAYPAMRAFVALDALLPLASGYMLLAHAAKRPERTAPYAPSSFRANASRE